MNHVHILTQNVSRGRVSLSGRRGVTLGKPDIKVETVNKETHGLEEEAADVSTATRMVKAMYSVSRRPTESPGAAERRRTGQRALTHTHTHKDTHSAFNIVSF